MNNEKRMWNLNASIGWGPNDPQDHILIVAKLKDGAQANDREKKKELDEAISNALRSRNAGHLVENDIEGETDLVFCFKKDIVHPKNLILELGSQFGLQGNLNIYQREYKSWDNIQDVKI